MKRLLAAMTVGLVAMGMAVSAKAHPSDPYIHQLQRQVTWQQQHIHQLNQRRAYLHTFIWHMRRDLRGHAAPSSTATSYPGPPPAYPSAGSWADDLRAVGFPESAIPHMLYIIQRESGGDPRAVNASSGACGLTQLYPCYGGAAWLDPITNLRMALQKYRAAGFAPWGG